MKTRALALFSMALLISGVSSAQEKILGEKIAGSHTSTKVLIVLGKVSSDARTLLTDLDSEWKVTNSEILKGYEDRIVRVRCYIDAEKSQLQILSVKKDSRETLQAARYSDSAFRR